MAKKPKNATPPQPGTKEYEELWGDSPKNEASVSTSAQKFDDVLKNINPKKQVTVKDYGDIVKATGQQIEDATNAHLEATEAANTTFNNKMSGFTKEADNLGDAAVARQKETNEAYLGTFGQWLSDAQKKQEETAKAYEEANKRNHRVMVGAGIADVIANIANLIGTTHGADPMQWTSPMSEWQQRAEEIRREGEAKNEALQDRYLQIQQQQAQARYGADSQLNQMQANNDQAKLGRKMDDASRQYGQEREVAGIRFQGNMQQAQHYGQGAMGALQFADSNYKYNHPRTGGGGGSRTVKDPNAGKQVVILQDGPGNNVRYYIDPGTYSELLNNCSDEIESLMSATDKIAYASGNAKDREALLQKYASRSQQFQDGVRQFGTTGTQSSANNNSNNGSNNQNNSMSNFFGQSGQ